MIPGGWSRFGVRVVRRRARCRGRRTTLAVARDVVVRHRGMGMMRVGRRTGRGTIAGDAAQLAHYRRGADYRDEHERDHLPEHAVHTIT